MSLHEGLTHIEDLGINDFISRIENMSDMIISEKLDGANLWMGFDLNGKFFTSRAGKTKNIKPFYSVKDYPNTSAYSGFKSAHQALEQSSKKIAKHLKPGQSAEVEILFGRQPNAVTYGVDGKSFIAFIRPVEGFGDEMATEADIEKLEQEFENDEITVNSEILTSTDGETLTVEKTPITWKIVKTQTLDSKELKSINFTKELNALKKYLATKNKDVAKLGFDFTNGEVAGISLTKIPKEQREQIKEFRTQVQDEILNSFKLPIKEKLLNDFVRKIKPKLQGTDLDDSENTGVEGVVLRDPTTHEQFKIVDKDIFTTVNAFNWGIRAAIDGIVKTDDPLATREMRGGAVGDSMIRIANLLGTKELAKSATAKRFLSKFQGKNEYDTAKNFADNLKDLNFGSAKTKIRAILNSTVDEVQDMLQTYKKEVDSYKVELKNGKEVKYSPEVKRRTLTAFAEVKSNLKNLINGIDEAKNFTGLILVLYSRALKGIFDQDVNESIIINESKQTNLKAIANIDHDEIAGSYLATLIAIQFLLKTKNKKVLKYVKDSKTNAAMKKFDPSMSELNFWGLVLFYPERKEVKEVLNPLVYRKLWKTGHRFLTSRIKTIHTKLSNQSSLLVDWHEQAENLRVVTLRLEQRDNSMNIIRRGIMDWNSLTLDEKETVMAKVYYFVTRYISSSPLVGLLREVSDELLLNANDERKTSDIKMSEIDKMTKLKEDGEGGGGDAGGSVGVETSPAAGTSFPLMSGIVSAGAVGGKDIKLFKGKVIQRRTRGYKVNKLYKFKKGAKNNE